MMKHFKRFFSKKNNNFYRFHTKNHVSEASYIGRYCKEIQKYAKECKLLRDAKGQPHGNTVICESIFSLFNRLVPTYRKMGWSTMLLAIRAWCHYHNMDVVNHLEKGGKTVLSNGSMSDVNLQSHNVQKLLLFDRMSCAILFY